MSTQSHAIPLRTHAPEPPRAPTPEQLILDAVRAIRYGTVQITIHDSQVVQIERTEKVRLNDRR